MMNQPSPIPRGRSAGAERTQLYSLCYANLPGHRKVVPSKRGVDWRGLDIEKIGNDIGVSPQKVSLWMKRNSMPGQRIKAMIELEGSTLTYEVLGPYINTR